MNRRETRYLLDNSSGDSAWDGIAYPPTTQGVCCMQTLRVSTARVASLAMLIALFASAFLFMAMLSAPVNAAEEVRLENPYIAITVTAQGENAGRFAVRTTGGDPSRLGDENQHLLFQQAGVAPRGSYTTFRIDDVDYVFGGATQWIAGADGAEGSVIQYPVVVEMNGREEILAIWQLGPIQVTQRLYFVRSSTTGLFDTGRIHYEVENIGDTTHIVGSRIMLDTELGENDGAPFRVGDQAVETDTVYTSNALPDFWQAFDSLSNPRVIGQGTLRGENLTVPDRVYFTNWGALAEGVWDFNFEPGRDFSRIGAPWVLDSAIALMWDPQPLMPGEIREYVTDYGLGGVSIVRGDLSLGITSPARIESPETKSFPVIVYVQNTGEGEARDVTIELCVPSGLSLPNGQQCAIREIGHMPLDGVSQVTWDVQLDSSVVGGDFSYSVEARAENLPNPVKASRNIRILGPPELKLSIAKPEGVIDGVFDRWAPPLHTIEATVTNVGDTPAKEVELVFNAPLGIGIAPVDRAQRLVGELAPGESWTVSWQVALGSRIGNVVFQVRAIDHGSNIPAVTATEFIDVRFRSSGMLQLPEKGTAALPAAVGGVLPLEILAENIRDMESLTVQIAYDPEYLWLLEGMPGMFGVYRGDLFTLTEDERQAFGVDQSTELIAWEIEHIPPGDDGLARVRIRGDRTGVGRLEVATGKVGSIRFVAEKAGETPILLEIFRVGDTVESDVDETDRPSQVDKQGITVHIAP